MNVVKIRTELGHRVFEIECPCPDLMREGKEPQRFLINLDEKSETYSPITRLVKCSRCKDVVRQESVLMKEEQNEPTASCEE